MADEHPDEGAGIPISDEEPAQMPGAPAPESARGGGDFEGFENGGAPEPAAPPAKPPSPAPAPASAEVRRLPRSLYFARIVQAIWFGSGVFLAFAAFAIFRVLDPVDAGDAVGAMLVRWHYIALLAPAILILVEWHRMRSRMVMILFIAVILAVLQGFTDLRIRRIRASSPVAISSLDRNDPLRRRFGALHGFSSILLVAQIAAAAAAIAAEPEPDV